MINKNYFIFAAAVALASCSVDEYMGENPEFTQTTKENIIGFGGGTGSMSRATQNTGNPEVMLDKHFKVYGCKSTSTSGTYQTVFNNYWVWYDTNTSSSTSNSNSWEYVGNSGTTIKDNDGNSVGSLQTAQYIKYWDYSADHYRFVAGTPQSQVTFNVDNTSKNVTGATVTGLAGHISPTGSATSKSQNPVYISAPIQINKKSNTSQKYGDPVQLTFTRLQTKVRVGIYETIPGYKITEISFYEQSGTKPKTNQNNVILTSATPDYFNGGAKVKATVTYNWGDGSTVPSYSVQYAKADDGTESDFVKSQNWYGGQFNNGGQLNQAVLATSSNPTGDDAISTLYGTDNDMGDNGYFTVLSTTKAPSALVIKCDFTLTSLDGSGETIKVTGATAAIPDAYCKWDENKMYTYIFKISQNTNGTTGTTGDKEGLFPITFDAVATATQEGVETIVQTPSITTHQTDAAVTANGIEYKTDVAIDITVQDGTQVKTPNTTEDSEGCVKVYYLGETEKTEAELVVTRPTTTTTKTVTPEGNTAKFTPEAGDITGEIGTYGYYAIEYCYKPTPSAAYKYKVIKVKKNN